MSEKLKVAVLVEFHPFDIMGFQKMLWSFDDCDCYVQALDLFVQDEKNQEKYDVVLYYNLSLPKPSETHMARPYFENKLGRTAQGIILLHHALLSFPGWDLWTDVSGVAIRCVDGIFQYHPNQVVPCKIIDARHAITQGVHDWTMQDETYIMGEPSEDNHILIKTDHVNSIKNLAWTRQYQKSRVFCYASGHDDLSYSNNQFRTILHQAIRWCARRI